MLETFLFFLFAVLSVVGGLGLLIAKSPVTGALWMVQTMISIACLYLTLNAEFLGVIQVMVYAGAIMVLFLFVIMLLNLQAPPDLGALDLKKVTAFVVGVGVLAQLLAVLATEGVLPGAPAATADVPETSATELGVALLTDHAFSLEIIGVLLLAATIGAVMLAKKRFI